MNILVTGGAGYIGSHTCVALLDAGKAKKELGWVARRDIVDMCRDAWRFEKKYG